MSILKYKKAIVAIIGAAVTWAVTYFPGNHTIQVVVGLVTVVLTSLGVYQVTNSADAPAATPAPPAPAADSGESFVGFLYILALLAVIVAGSFYIAGKIG